MDDSNLTVYVDADACPVTEIILEEASDREIWMVHNRHHDISVDRKNVFVKETGDRADAADHWIANRLEEGDLVITDDLGLATLVVGRGARVLRFRGDRVTNETIDLKLAMRDAAARHRKKPGTRGGGPPALTEQDRTRFRRRLRDLLNIS